MTEHNFVGKYICYQRETIGKTTREMAKELGITPSKLNDIEMGNTLPNLELLQQIQKKYGIECSACIEFLLNRQEKKTKKSNKYIPKVQVCYVRNNNSYHQM